MEYDDTKFILSLGEEAIPFMFEMAKVFGATEESFEPERKRIQEILDKAKS